MEKQVPRNCKTWVNVSLFVLSQQGSPHTLDWILRISSSGMFMSHKGSLHLMMSALNHHMKLEASLSYGCGSNSPPVQDGRLSGREWERWINQRRLCGQLSEQSAVNLELNCSFILDCEDESSELKLLRINQRSVQFKEVIHSNVFFFFFFYISQDSSWITQQHYHSLGVLFLAL